MSVRNGIFGCGYRAAEIAARDNIREQRPKGPETGRANKCRPLDQRAAPAIDNRTVASERAQPSPVSSQISSQSVTRSPAARPRPAAQPRPGPRPAPQKRWAPARARPQPGPRPTPQRGQRRHQDGQYRNPVRIAAFNTTEGWSRDVTEEIAVALHKRCADAGAVPQSLQQFLEQHGQ